MRGLILHAPLLDAELAGEGSDTFVELFFGSEVGELG